MLVTDLEKYREKVWLGVNDVIALSCVGHDKAKQIIKDINDKRRKEKLYIPNENKISSKDFFKYLGI